MPYSWRCLLAAERTYRRIFENVSEGIFQSTPEGAYLMANPALARIHGFSSPSELIRSCRDISREIYVDPQRRDEFKRLLEKHGLVRDFEHESFRKDGSRIWLSVNARAVKDEDGKVLYYEGTARDITQRKQAEQALRESEAAARTYSRHLIEAQEGERRRMSRELHDQLGQILTAVKINLHVLRQKCTAPEVVSSIEDNMKVIDEAVDQVRDLSGDLRPSLLDDFGLVVAVRWYVDRQAKSCGVPADFTTRSLDDDDRFSSELETACFRIVQEAVTNAARHARASRISVVLERAGQELVLSISDDGAGFNLKALRTSAATVGLRSMEERVQAVGGSITINSAPELGTAICARLPIPHRQGRTRSAVVNAAMS
ncbi:MAG TPA: PAS domain-containing sensor histidine kinase [Pyrinomonadaceae bacterium]|nr:PAS domain-containing sensor histidine kinase [Pyrinomonadaceae bacterium]